MVFCTWCLTLLSEKQRKLSSLGMLHSFSSEMLKLRPVFCAVFTCGLCVYCYDVLLPFTLFCSFCTVYCSILTCNRCIQPNLCGWCRAWSGYVQASNAFSDALQCYLAAARWEQRSRRRPLSHVPVTVPGLLIWYSVIPVCVYPLLWVEFSLWRQDQIIES